jgi:hypothetical protein
MTRWIGDGEEYSVGQIGFLLTTCRDGRDERGYLSEHPGHTNMSHERRLYGWLGTSDDVAHYAHGMARVTRIAQNGRACVVTLAGAELAAALEQLGYPELAV